MKRIILFIIITLSFLSGSFAQIPVCVRCWSSGTAFTLPKNRIEMDLFRLSSIGLTDKLELSAHPLMMFLLPQIELKAGWGKFAGATVATEHELTYPTFFLGTVSMKGTGGLISPEYHYPQMIAIYNGFLATWGLFKNADITGKAGVAFSVRSGSLNPYSTIDLPVIYPRLKVFYHNQETDLAFGFRWRFLSLFGWQFSGESFIFPGASNNFFFENRSALDYYSKKQILRIQLGYKLCYGLYPPGPQWHFLPVIDLALGFPTVK